MLLTREKNFYRDLLVLSIPIMLQNLITFAVGFADNLMVGSLGDVAISGVYMGNQVQTALQMLSVGIEGGILILSAQYWGKRDTESIRKIASIGIMFSLILGAFMTVVCALIPTAVISVFTDEPEVIKSGASYLSIVCYSYIFFCLTQALVASMRSVESAKIGLAVSVVSLVSNVFLNYVFIFGKLGAEPMAERGAALATLISRILETAVILIYVRFIDKKLCYRFRMLLKISRELLHDYVRYGMPIVGGQLVWGCNLIANSMILGRFSETVITGTSLAGTMNNMMYVVMNGLASAVGIIIGKTVGSGNIKKIREYSVTVQILFAELGILTGAAIFALRTPFISLFQVSEEARTYAFQFITVLSITMVGTCYQCASLFGLVKSGGDVGFVFKNDTVFVFGVVIPSALITALCGCPPWVVFLCLKCDQILKCIVAFFKIRKYDWMKNLTREGENGKEPLPEKQKTQ